MKSEVSSEYERPPSTLTSTARLAGTLIDEIGGGHVSVSGATHTAAEMCISAEVAISAVPLGRVCRKRQWRLGGSAFGEFGEFSA